MLDECILLNMKSSENKDIIIIIIIIVNLKFTYLHHLVYDET